MRVRGGAPEGDWWGGREGWQLHQPVPTGCVRQGKVIGIKEGKQGEKAAGEQRLSLQA